MAQQQTVIESLRSSAFEALLAVTPSQDPVTKLAQGIGAMQGVWSLSKEQMAKDQDFPYEGGDIWTVLLGLEKLITQDIVTASDQEVVRVEGQVVLGRLVRYLPLGGGDLVNKISGLLAA